MQTIPGTISISPSELQILTHSGEFPPVTMTTQTGLMLHGEQPQAFVITNKGVCKHQHLVELLERQVRTCFAINNLVQAPAVVEEAPPPPPPFPPTADQPCANPEYFVRHLQVGEHRIKMHIPIGRGADTKRVVLYLASTQGEEAPTSAFEGSEIVYAPQVTNHGRKPWKNDVPDWLLNWVAQAQVNDVSCQWCLCGVSRGAAWGAILAADVRLTFRRCLLVAPYVLPSCSDRCRGMLTVRLPTYKKNLCIAFGSADPWQPCNVFQQIQQSCRSRVFEGLGHDESIRQGVQDLWKGLMF